MAVGSSHDACAGPWPRDERHRTADRRETHRLPVSPDHQWSTGARPGRERSRTRRRDGQGSGRRSARPEEAAQVVGARRRALLRVLGVPDPRLGLPRGLRLAVPRRLRHPDHRPLGLPGLRAGLHRRDGRHLTGRVLDHPAEECARAAGPQVPLRGLAPGRRLAGAADDLLRRAVDVPVPRAPAPTPATFPTATGRSPRTRPASCCPASARTPTRSSSTSACWRTSA